MICNNCGTETGGPLCVYCLDEAPAPGPAITTTPERAVDGDDLAGQLILLSQRCEEAHRAAVRAGRPDAARELRDMGTQIFVILTRNLAGSTVEAKAS